ncbi:hypothetical protein E2P86_08970 [Sphingobacterium psychroaquaticum]|uniref:hypothetical protein n=1 Tax=Sphingobacterium psychroaquaticum TaxID=561061 RepID=UPI00106A4493|nr:hypothetical protein [Sphingobacterium psychroaquaticum]QBQ41280.1 hypothetical protein E2P86_08970 [Sphingobacterium psychroaquaticum]
MRSLRSLALSLCILLASCGGAEKAMQKRIDKLHIGMTIPEFKTVMREASTVYLSEDYSAFKVMKSRVKYGYGYVYSTRFFYFQDGKLWRIDEGERAVDYRVKVD